MLDYASLAALTAVIREGGFDRAASALGVTPSAVSQRIRALEDRIGATLVIRGQPPVPTQAGARLSAHYNRVALLEGELAESLPGIARSDRPVTLRIAVNADSLACWFLPAATRFAQTGGALLDLVLDGEGETAERLRSGNVLAAVTADPTPVAGCRIRPLGALRYVATASPAFVRRHFPDGVSATSLARAPTLRFDQKDDLQNRWACATFGHELDAPTHWVPSTQAFLDASLAGLAWTLNPLLLARDPLASGRLVELAPGHPLDVALHWQHAGIGARLLDALTREVTAAAPQSLLPVSIPPGPAESPSR